MSKASQRESEPLWPILAAAWPSSLTAGGIIYILFGDPIILILQPVWVACASVVYVAVKWGVGRRMAALLWIRRRVGRPIPRFWTKRFNQALRKIF